MTLRTPTYLTKNRLGIFIFQARIPKRAQQNYSIYRKSLRTRDRGLALQRARKLKVMFDEIIARFFADENHYKEGMRLLARYSQIENGDWETSVEPFLCDLDEYKSLTLEAAIEYRAQRDNKPAAPSNLDNERLDKIERSLALLAERHVELTDKPLSELINEYISEKRAKWKESNIDGNTIDLQPKLTLLVELIGNIGSKSLTPNDVRLYKTALYRLPSNRTKGDYKDIPTRELVDVTIDKIDLLSDRTRINHATKLSSFLHWLSQNNYAVAGLSDPLRDVQGSDKAASEERSMFSEDELTRLFESRQYLQGSHNKPSHYWVPLLALFTGARQNELCQLYREDIYSDTDNGVWVIDINEEQDKTLKKSSHARIVPIHKQLIALGFLDYIRTIDSGRIFPDINKQKGRYGVQISKWFCTTYLNAANCNIRDTNANVAFHSFRHNVVTQLAHRGVENAFIAHLVGHQPPGGTETVVRYLKHKDAKQKQMEINLLKYPSINFDKIRNWKHGYKPFRIRKKT